MAVDKSALPLFTVHEERISRLEQDTGELATAAADQAATMRALTYQVGSMKQDVLDRIEVMNDHIDERLDTLSDNDKFSSTKLSEYGERIKSLEKQESHKEKWSELGRKVLFYFLTSGAGAGAALLYEWYKGH